jgi:AraC-like DNA-binding protein
VPVLIDTQTLDADHRAEQWAAAHERIFFPIAVRASAGDLAGCRIERHALGPLSTYLVAGDPSIVERTTAGIRAFDPEHFIVATTLRGRCLIEQDGRGTVFTNGDLSSWDSSRPFAATHLERFELLLLIMPRALLGARRDAVFARTARCTAAASPLGSIAGHFFRELWDVLGTDSPVRGGDDLAEAAIAIARSLHADEPAERRLSAAALLPRIKGYIQEHLADPGLGPESIARANYISVRYLHKLFAAEPESVCQWIRRRRHEACRRDLVDPSLAGHTIAEVAMRWALPNSAYFSRAFRDAYGCTPTEWRNRAR